MSRNNNNAGMHVIRRNYNYDEPWVYDERERRKYEILQLKKEFQEQREKEQHEAFVKQISDIKRIGTSLIDTVYSNIAYYACENDINLRHVTAEINHFIESYVQDFEKLDSDIKVLFYLGLVAEKLEIETGDLFINRNDEIEEYFIDVVITMLKESYTSYRKGAKGLCMTTYHDGDSRVLFYPEDDSPKPVYSIDICFDGMLIEREYDAEYGEHQIIPLGYNVVYSDSNKRLIEAYKEAEFYYNNDYVDPVEEELKELFEKDKASKENKKPKSNNSNSRNRNRAEIHIVSSPKE